jgi:two-component system chemotaxis sensor kinase CheA
MTDSLDRKEFVVGYVAEANEHLANANSNLLAIEEGQRLREPRPRATRELFRALHTMKGLSAMIGAEPIVDLAHEMEELLRSADRAGGRVPAGAVDLLLRGVRAIEARVASVANDEPVAAAPEDLLAAIAGLQRPEGAQAGAELELAPELVAKLSPAEKEQLARGIAAGRAGRRVDFVPSPERAARGVNITSVRERLGAVAEIVKVLPRIVAASDDAPAGLAFALLVLADAPDARLAEAADASADAVSPIGLAASSVAEEEPAEDLDLQRRSFVRVEVSRLDDAMDRLSALVVTASRLRRTAAELAGRGADVRALTAVLQDHGRQLRDLRASVLCARMVRVSELLERAPLIVRGLSQSSGKPVRLQIDAGGSEVDKAVGERLFPAIVHLLRNAVDHAIEPIEERRRAGKPDDGRIVVSCRERSDHELELVIEDDGRGIDREAVARRAGAPVPQSGPELLELIARPGLSTSEQATRTSGRGIGMDVVRRMAVVELGGELALETRAGAGTRFTIRVPLSITVVEVITLQCGGESFVVPITAIHDLVEVDEAAVTHGPDPARRGTIRLLRRNDEALPLVRLDALLGLENGPEARRRPKALVVRSDGEALAFEVDRVIGQQEVVVRPLSDPLVRVRGIAGSADLGDGRPTLVLDIAELSRSLAEVR